MGVAVVGVAVVAVVAAVVAVVELPQATTTIDTISSRIRIAPRRNRFFIKTPLLPNHTVCYAPALLAGTFLICAPA